MLEESIKNELSFSFSRSSGAGGQNVNKVNTRATLSWEINSSKLISSFVKERFISRFKRFINQDGIVLISSQKFRVQSRNIADCEEKLLSMLQEVATPPKRRIDTKPTKGSVKRRINDKKNKGDIKKNRKKVDY